MPLATGDKPTSLPFGSCLPCTFRCTIGALGEPCLLAPPKGSFSIQQSEKLNGFCNEPCPSGLMTGTKPGAVIAVEVFIEEDVVAPVRIALELLGTTVDGSKSLLVKIVGLEGYDLEVTRRLPIEIKPVPENIFVSEVQKG